jgi:hypothetical protein
MSGLTFFNMTEIKDQFFNSSFYNKTSKYWEDVSTIDYEKQVYSICNKISPAANATFLVVQKQWEDSIYPNRAFLCAGLSGLAFGRVVVVSLDSKIKCKLGLYIVLGGISAAYSYQLEPNYFCQIFLGSALGTVTLALRNKSNTQNRQNVESNERELQHAHREQKPKDKGQLTRNNNVQSSNMTSLQGKPPEKAQSQGQVAEPKTRRSRFNYFGGF